MTGTAHDYDLKMAKALPEVAALIEACDMAYRTEWPHQIYVILMSRNTELGNKFAAFMQPFHVAMSKFVENKPLAQEAEQTQLSLVSFEEIEK